MKKFVVCTVALILSQAASAGPKLEGGDIKWADETFTGSVAYHDGRVYGFGDNESGTEGLVRAYTAKNGRLRWEQRFTALFFAPSQIIVTDDMVYVVGAKNDGAETGIDWFIAAMDADDGELEWQKTIAAPGAGFANSVAASGDNIVVVGGEFLTDDFGGPSRFVARGFDADDGDLEWEDLNPNVGASFGDKAVAVMRRDDDDDDDDDDEEDWDDDGGMVLGYGVINNDVNGTDKIVRAYDSESGHILWTTIVDSGRQETGRDFFVVEDGVAYFSFLSFTPGEFPATWQVEAINVHDGSPVWTALKGPVFFQAFGLVIERGELVAVKDCAAYGIDTHDGDTLWETPLFPPDNCFLHPTIAKGRLVTAGFDFSVGEFTVTALDAGDGTQEWITRIPGAFPQAFINQFNFSDSITSGGGLVFVGGSRLTALKVR